MFKESVYGADVLVDDNLLNAESKIRSIMLLI